MQASGRITHSFFCFLDQRYFDVSQFHELTSIDISFIKDPSVWMDIDLVENFLRKVSDEYGRHFVDKELTTSVGHGASDLKAWGDLDNVLRLSSFSNFYLKIDEILQWFISPFEVQAFRRSSKGFSFQCNLSSVEYPYIVEYLRSMLEILPVFKSEETAEVKWDRFCVQIQPHPFRQMSFALEDEAGWPGSFSYQDHEVISVFSEKEKINLMCRKAEDLIAEMKSSPLKNLAQNLSTLKAYITAIRKELEVEPAEEQEFKGFSQ